VIWKLSIKTTERTEQENKSVIYNVLYQSDDLAHMLQEKKQTKATRQMKQFTMNSCS